MVAAPIGDDHAAACVHAKFGRDQFGHHAAAGIRRVGGARHGLDFGREFPDLGEFPRGGVLVRIGGSLQPAGVLIVDEGAAKALGQGRSLLPAGIIDVTGAFQRGDAVTIKRRDGREIGRGLVNYSADDARRIIGHKTDEIEGLLGYRGRDAMVHRDDLVIL